MNLKTTVAGRIPSEVKKIGILRANALGDFIVTLPAIQALRKTYPEAEIVLLGKPWHKKFLEETENEKRRTPVDRVEIIPVIKGLREERDQQEVKEETEEFLRKMQEEKFDVLLSFQGKGIAAIPFLKRIGAKFIAGLACEDAEKPDAYFDFYYYQPESLRYIEIAGLSGAKNFSPEPEIFFLSKDFDEAVQFFRKYNLTRYICIHACGTDLRRMWTKEKFALLLQQLHFKGFEIVLTGSQEDAHYNEDIIKKSSIPAINAAGKLSLGAVAVLYQKAEAVVSVDTGPLHLAIASGARTVGLYWAPNLINWGPLTRRNHRPVINWNMLCPQCGITPNRPFPFEPSNECTHPVSFIENITVEEVITNLMQLLTDSSFKN